MRLYDLGCSAFTAVVVTLRSSLALMSEVVPDSNALLFTFASHQSPLRQDADFMVPVTTGVTPRRIHSHNDYEQSVPLLKALSFGASSVEADIWLKDGQLLVGHTEKELSKNRTLQSLYLEPLMGIIQANNASSSTPSNTNGIFITASSLPLHLLIDIKTDGPTTFPHLYEALDPLRRAGYLSSWTAGQQRITNALITVIGTGNTPADAVRALGQNSGKPRDVFLDAPLTRSSSPEDLAATLDPTVSPLASGNFRQVIGFAWLFPHLGSAKTRALVEAAHAKGVQTRFWNTPSWPHPIRNYVWGMVLRAGSDWLNVDDLPAAAAF